MANQHEKQPSIFFEIVPGKGPSKLDLLMAFANAFPSCVRTPSEPTRVLFEVKRPNRQQDVVTKFYTRVYSITHENSSGESFLIWGYASTQKEWPEGPKNERKFTGYYNCRSRTGHIELLKD